jgi:hypothetical protein
MLWSHSALQWQDGIEVEVSRLAGVSEAETRWRNPERTEEPVPLLVGPPGFEPGTNRL